MNNKDLLDLKNKLAALPVLKNRLQKLEEEIVEAEREVKRLLQKYEKESLDVEQIQKNSLSATLLKLIGKYEDRVVKESGEMLHAKTEYDAAVNRLEELKREREEMRRRLSDLNRDKHTYEAELKKREDKIKSGLADTISVQYKKLEEEQDSMRRQLAETEEALRAASRALSTARSALEQLGDAESWATYDIWFGKGIISHMAKYSHIDSAEEQLNRLRSQIRDLEKELKDVNLTAGFSPSNIDTATRVIDFWFDNIFTDISVRSQIRDSREQIVSICGKIERIINKLESVKSDMNQQIMESEKKKNALIISYEE